MLEDVTPEAPPPGRRKKPALGELMLSYTLSTLPSVQHRAGLAGLLLFIDLCGPFPGVEVQARTEDRLDLSLTERGLGHMLDVLYAADRTERTSRSKWPGATPLRREKDGWVYEVVEPRLSFLEKLEPEAPAQAAPPEETEGAVEETPEGAAAAPPQSLGQAYRRLYRDFVWQVPRGRPMARGPYLCRAEGTAQKDTEALWKELCQDGAVDLVGTYYLGGQAATAEGRPITDTARRRFLLHFHLLVLDLQLPPLGQGGFFVVLPEVEALGPFVAAFPAAQRARSGRLAGSRPAGALVLLPEQAVYHTAARLGSCVVAFEVLEMAKEGNNVVLRRQVRVEPEPEIAAEMAWVEAHVPDRLLQRHVLKNLVGGRPWETDLFCLRDDPEARPDPHRNPQHLFDRPWFLIGLRRLFQRTPAGRLPHLLYRLVQRHLEESLAASGLSWARVKDSEEGRARYGATRRARAARLFDAGQGLRGEALYEWLVRTLCAGSQWMSTDEIVMLDEADRAELHLLIELVLRASRSGKEDSDG